jgi:hypothetical protein
MSSESIDIRPAGARDRTPLARKHSLTVAPVPTSAAAGLLLRIDLVLAGAAVLMRIVGAASR